jgi:hypothetical protein
MSDGQWAITIKQKTNGKWRTLPCCPKLLKHFYDMLELCSQWPTLRNGNLEFILNMVLVLSASVKDRQIWKIWEYKLWTVVQDLEKNYRTDVSLVKPLHYNQEDLLGSILMRQIRHGDRTDRKVAMARFSLLPFWEDFSNMVHADGSFLRSIIILWRNSPTD